MWRAPTATSKRDHGLIFEVADFVNIVIRFRVSMTENTLINQTIRSFCPERMPSNEAEM